MMDAITEWIKKHIFEWAKEYPKYFLPFGLFSALCLFLPDKVLTAAGLLGLRNQFKPYLGAALLLSITFIVSIAFLKAFEWARDKYLEWAYKRRVIKRLKQITKEESDILISYVKEKTYTRSLNYLNGVVKGLVINDIIYQATKLTRTDFLDYSMLPWVWDYLNTHPELFNSHK